MPDNSEIEINIESGEIQPAKTVATPPEDEGDFDTDQGSETSLDSNTSEGETSDRELEGAADEDGREAIRERRRQERQHRKLAQREREETLRRELASRDAAINELRQKVDLFERRNDGSEIAKLASAKQETARAYAFFKDQIRLATDSKDGAGVADATEKMIQAQRKFDELSQYENAMRQKQSAPQPLNPSLVSHAKAWMEKNKWYNPAASDQDSEIAMQLDKRMGAEGWDPTTPQYWEELTSRVKKYLPHRFAGGKMTNIPPGVPIAGSGREASTVQNGGSFKLSSERVNALKEAGIWDDPKKRAEAVKRYREYDNETLKGNKERSV